MEDKTEVPALASLQSSREDEAHVQGDAVTTQAFTMSPTMAGHEFSKSRFTTEGGLTQRHRSETKSKQGGLRGTASGVALI